MKDYLFGRTKNFLKYRQEVIAKIPKLKGFLYCYQNKGLYQQYIYKIGYTEQPIEQRADQWFNTDNIYPKQIFYFFSNDVALLEHYMHDYFYYYRFQRKIWNQLERQQKYHNQWFQFLNIPIEYVYHVATSMNNFSRNNEISPLLTVYNEVANKFRNVEFKFPYYYQIRERLNHFQDVQASLGQANTIIQYKMDQIWKLLAQLYQTWLHQQRKTNQDNMQEKLKRSKFKLSQDQNINSNYQRSRQSYSAVEKEADQRTLYVSGLAPQIKKQQLQQIFGKHGRVISVYIREKKDLRFAYIQYQDPASRQKARIANHRQNLRGKLMNVQLYDRNRLKSSFKVKDSDKNSQNQPKNNCQSFGSDQAGDMDENSETQKRKSYRSLDFRGKSNAQINTSWHQETDQNNAPRYISPMNSMNQYAPYNLKQELEQEWQTTQIKKPAAYDDFQKLQLQIKQKQLLKIIQKENDDLKRLNKQNKEQFEKKNKISVKKIEQLKQSNNKLKNQSIKLEQELNGNKIKLNASEFKVSCMQQHIIQVEKQNSKAKQEITELQGKMKRFQHIEAQSISGKQKIHQLLAEIEFLRSKLQDVQKENEKLVNNFLEKHIQCQQLRARV